MSRASEDPFYTLRDDVKIQVDQVKVRHDKFQELVRTVDTSTNAEFIELRKNLGKDVRLVEKKLKGLKDAVDVVERNRTKFPQIRDSELQARKSFVDSVQIVVNDVKVGLESPAVRKKMESDTMRHQRATFESNSSAARTQSTNAGNTPVRGQPYDPANPYKAALESENDAVIRDQQTTQKLMIKKQDENLKILEKGVDSLHVMAKDIHQELKEQDKLLDSLGNEVDDSRSRLDTVMASLNKLLKQKDGCQMWTIVILSLILIILIALVIWT